MLSPTNSSRQCSQLIGRERYHPWYARKKIERKWIKNFSKQLERRSSTDDVSLYNKGNLSTSICRAADSPLAASSVARERENNKKKDRRRSRRKSEKERKKETRLDSLCASIIKRGLIIDLSPVRFETAFVELRFSSARVKSYHSDLWLERDLLPRCVKPPLKFTLIARHKWRAKLLCTHWDRFSDSFSFIATTRRVCVCTLKWKKATRFSEAELSRWRRFSISATWKRWRGVTQFPRVMYATWQEARLIKLKLSYHVIRLLSVHRRSMVHLGRNKGARSWGEK